MQLARHSVLLATDCPESLGGSLRLLGVLREVLRAHRSTWLDDRDGWQQAIESLEQQIRLLEIRHGDAPTEADKRSDIWREVHACLDQRSQARAMATVRDTVDLLLLRMILVCSAEHRRMDPSTINALRQLYKLGAHVSGGNRDWRNLLLALQGGKDLSMWLAEAQTTLVIKRFCKNLHPFLKSTVGSPITAGRQLLSTAADDALGEASTQGSEGADQEEANPLSLDLTDPTAIATSKRRPFVQGDSILEHCCQSVLRDPSLARLGEHHWDCAPPAIAKRVSSRLVHRMRDTKCLDELGTCLVANTPKNQARKRWMADHLQLRGSVRVDDGAVQKILGEGKSLLPIGMTAVEGEFSRGDVIAVRDGAGQEIARGLANYASSEARLLCRKSSNDFERLLGYVAESEMIHRDNLVLSRS